MCLNGTDDSSETLLEWAACVRSLHYNFPGNPFACMWAVMWEEWKGLGKTSEHTTVYRVMLLLFNKLLLSILLQFIVRHVVIGWIFHYPEVCMENLLQHLSFQQNADIWIETIISPLHPLFLLVRSSSCPQKAFPAKQGIKDNSQLPRKSSANCGFQHERFSLEIWCMYEL